MLAHHFSLARRIYSKGTVLILPQIKEIKLLKVLEKRNLISKSFLRITEFYGYVADAIRARILEVCS